MILDDIIIMFKQKIEDINPVFGNEQRPTTFAIINYLNKGVLRYLQERYLNYPTYYQRYAAFDQNTDELRELLIRSGSSIGVLPNFTNNWGSRGKRYAIPDDVLFLLSVSCVVNRQDLFPATAENMFADFVTRHEAEKVVSDVHNNTIYLKPMVLWEDGHVFAVIGDAYTTSITVNDIAYLRKPWLLSFDYTVLEGTTEGGNLSISEIPTSVYFKAYTPGGYYNESFSPITIYPGQKVKKISGYNTITGVSGIIQKVGYPWGYTNTFEFPEYMHSQLIDNAVDEFIKEGKLMLVQKQEK